MAIEHQGIFFHTCCLILFSVFVKVRDFERFGVKFRDLGVRGFRAQGFQGFVRLGFRDVGVK